MLEELHIRDFAIIDELTVRFGPGLNVLTGETGAGKSILIGAIQWLMGARARTDQVREGAQEALVEGLILLAPEEEVALHNVLRLQGISPSDALLLRRIVSRAGRSRVYVNGQLCTLQTLSEVARRCMNIYGQHEHQSLLAPDRHLDLLDEFGGFAPLRKRWEDLWSSWRSLRQQIEEARRRREEAERDRDLWEFQQKEIEGADLKPGEEEELELERQRLIHGQRIQEGLALAEQVLYTDKGSALERLQETIRQMQTLARYDQELGSLLEILEGVAVDLEEAVHRIRALQGRTELDPDRLWAVEERLAEIRRLRRKYGGSVEEIRALAAELRGRLAALERHEEDLEAMQEREQRIVREMLKAGEELTQARREAGLTLSREVERELRDLGIERPVFKVEIGALDEGESLDGEGGRPAGPRGMDRVRFLLSTNVGESPRPLARIASGGELSRIMLALKKVLAEAERVPTLIFDEIDAGIGGAVAQAVGEKLAHIARSHQVLCITHLPQIAGCASYHYRVAKVVTQGRTVTRVEPLEEEQRVEEISRMLGGRRITDKTRAHARELLMRRMGQ